MDSQKNEYSILFIEDDVIALQNYSLALEEHFENVYQAKDGLSAYDIYMEKKPDIMIIDVDIPKLSGIELLKKIRKTDQNTKAILFTSHSDTKTLLNASSLKLTKYLIKPVISKELFDALDLAIEEIKFFSVVSNKILTLKDDFFWDIDKHILFNKKDEVSLTRIEKNILSIIFETGQNSRIITYHEIIDILWESNDEKALNSLKTFISALRKKLPEDTILNEYGAGYRLGIK